MWDNKMMQSRLLGADFFLQSPAQKNENDLKNEDDLKK